MNNSPIAPMMLVGAVIVATVTLSCYSILPYIGGSALIALDRIAFGFRWIGASSPVAAWALFGACIGGLAGAGMGLRQAGLQVPIARFGLAWLGLVAGLFILGALYSIVMPPIR